MMTSELERLHLKAKDTARRYRSSETELLQVLSEIESLRGYLPLGFNSLFSYCVSYLGLSESQSYSFMAVAKKGREIPEFKKAVESQEISFSHARKMVSVINSENQKQWLAKAKSLPLKALEREIVKENPQAPVVERLRLVSENESELKVGIDREMEADLKRIQELLRTSNLKQALKAVLKDYRMRHDPIERSKRAKHIAKTESTPVRFGARQNPRRSIPRHVFHDVQRRDNGRCQFKGTVGQVCGASFGVEVHHLEPWAYGGKHEAANLLTLCHRHHHYWHHRDQIPRTVRTQTGS